MLEQGKDRSSDENHREQDKMGILHCRAMSGVPIPRALPTRSAQLSSSLPFGRDFSIQPPKKTNTGHTLNISPVLKLCTNSNGSGIQTEEYFNNFEFEQSFQARMKTYR